MPKEFLGAFKHGHRPGVREYIDEEFSIELLKAVELGDHEALKALQWLTKFNNETYRGVLKKGDPESLHKSPELYKSATDGHNQRRRCLTSKLKSGALGPAQCQLISIEAGTISYENYISRDQNPSEFEDFLISIVTEIK